jgi:hypothetical protein
MSVPVLPRQDNPDDQGTLEELDVKLPQITTRQKPIDREATAAKLGEWIVLIFALSIFFCFVVVGFEIYKTPPQGNINLAASLSLLKEVSAIFSGLLGFVLGFYFRDGGRN